MKSKSSIPPLGVRLDLSGPQVPLPGGAGPKAPRVLDPAQFKRGQHGAKGPGAAGKRLTIPGKGKGR